MGYLEKEFSYSLIKKKKNNICCGYSLEVPHRGTSNGYPQHMLSLRNKTNIKTFLAVIAILSDKKSALSGVMTV